MNTPGKITISELSQILPGQIGLAGNGSANSDSITICEAVVNTYVVTKGFSFEQVIPSTFWAVNHRLGRKPSVVVVDQNDYQILPQDVHYVDLDNLAIYFDSDFAGSAYLN